MTGKDLFLGLEYLEETYIELAENGSLSRKKMPVRRAFLLAAIIALLCALVGCGIVYMLKMQDLKVGQTEVIVATGVSSQGTVSVQTESRQILTFSGIKGSANYGAAREWLEFENQFDPGYVIMKAAYDNPQEFPGEYDAYHIYSQEQADKLLEITEKYGLQLAGERVDARTPKSLLAYLNVPSLLVPNAGAALSNLQTKYYENGKFYADFYLLMEEGSDIWPHDTYCLYYYTPKACFDDHFVYLAETADWREWNYPTASGETALILRSDSWGEAYIFWDREDATAAVKIYTYWDDPKKGMTDAQLQQMVDQINVDFHPQPGDPALLQGFGGGIDTTQLKQTQSGYTLEVEDVKTDGEIAYVHLKVSAPEGTNLDGVGIHPTNRGEGLLLPDAGADRLPSLVVNWNTQEEDWDNKENTRNLVIIAEANTMDATGIRPGEPWTLYIEGLDISAANSLLQADVAEQIEGVWQFDITFDDEDFREIEFIENPVTIRGYIGGGNKAEGSITSLKLRRFSGTAIFADIAPDLNDYENEKYTCAVLKDGTEIRLHFVGGPENATGFRTEEEIPLDEVEYVILKDGTRLCPQNKPNG